MQGLASAVADTSPINYLVVIGVIDVLPALFDVVIIPAAVQAELMHPSTPLAARTWAANLPAWAKLSTAVPGSPWGTDLGAGESEALAIAMAEAPCTLIIDERLGTKVALEKGLPVIGTLGILEEGAKRHLLDLPDAIRRLQATSFRYPRPLVERLLREDAARRATG